MGNKIAVTDSGKHKIGKKLFLTDENLVHRKAKKAFLTKDGVHRLVFSSGTVWEKYNGQFSTWYEKINWYNKRMNLGSWSSPETFYGSYEFSSENGVSMMDEAKFNLNEDVNSIVGMYLEEALSEDDEWAVWVVTEAGYDDYGNWYYWYETVLSYGRYEGWERGDYFFGIVEAEEGELPEEGALEDGSPAGEYCVLYCEDDRCYYYVRKE